MPTVRDLLAAVETLAPPQYGFGFDKLGLQVGDPSATVSRVLVTLDCTLDVVRQARETGTEAIVAHHPLLFRPLDTVRLDDPKGKIVAELIQSGIAMIAAHTNWDCAPGGVNDALAAALGLKDVVPAGSRSDHKTWKLVVFVPEANRPAVQQAIGDAGAGRIGLYDQCVFWSSGTGTFRPLVGTNPAIGAVGEQKEVAENRLEALVPESRLGAVVAALVAAHPYEEPAYDLIPVKEASGYPLLRVGDLATPKSPAEFADHVDACLGTRCWLWPGGRPVQRVAVCGGAGDDEWRNTIAAGADTFVTGEVKHHNAVEASAAGLTLVAAGHYATEQPGMVALADELSRCVSSVTVSVHST